MLHRVLLMISSMRGGGSEQQTLLLLQHIDRSRFQPHLYVLERTGDLMSRLPEDVIVHAFDELRPASSFYYPGRVLRRQIRHVRNVLSENAIDVVYDRTFHMTMIAGAATSGLAVPRVSTIVSPPEYALPLVEKRFVSLKRRRLAQAYRQSYAVVAVSKQAAESAERYYKLPPHSVRVIHNGVDVESLRRQAARDSLEQSSGESLELICVGRMTEEKGHSDLVSAMILAEESWPDRLPPIRLRMIGDGPLRPQLQSRWQSSAGTHSIEFLGTLPSPASLVAAADALVLPSHFEGMPNVVLEAMALGTPVIATRAGGTMELERDQRTIYWVKPGDPESLVDAMIQLASDRDEAVRRTATASALIESHHNVHNVTTMIEDLLAEAIAGRDTQG